MTKHWTPLAIAYLVLALIGLAGTAAANALAVAQMRDVVGDWFGSGPAVSSMAIDLLVVAVAGSVLVLVEARRLGMRFAWVYLVLAFVTAFAFTFPLFLAQRERMLRRRADDASDVRGRAA